MRSTIQLLAAGLLVLASSSAAIAQKKNQMGTSEYYPTAEGSMWTYSTSEGTVTTKVVKHEEIGGVLCARIEATMTDNKKTSEYVRVTSDGVFRHRASEQTITKPLMFLKLPAAKTATWDVNSTVLGKTLKGTYKMTTGSVTIKGKKYDDVLIVTSVDFEIDGQKLPHTYWFAKGIGLVKQSVTFAGEKVEMELDSYTPPKS